MDKIIFISRGQPTLEAGAFGQDEFNSKKYEVNRVIFQQALYQTHKTRVYARIERWSKSIFVSWGACTID